MGDSAEDLFSADPVLGEVDPRWPGGSLSRRELAKGTVRPGRVVVAQVLGQHLAQMVLIDDQQPVFRLWTRCSRCGGAAAAKAAVPAAGGDRESGCR